ncbi:hypothetical protein J6590_001326 [Homalodisca vitripennis]|nr:hypothetical protein J6590_001326 [Homalodisca vitripennis]
MMTQKHLRDRTSWKQYAIVKQKRMIEFDETWLAKLSEERFTRSQSKSSNGSIESVRSVVLGSPGHALIDNQSPLLNFVDVTREFLGDLSGTWRRNLGSAGPSEISGKGYKGVKHSS